LAVVGLAWCASSTVPLACASDSCEAGEFRCEGTVAFVCSGEELEWVSWDCADEGEHCAEGQTEAFCAVSPEPDPRCPQESSVSAQYGPGWCDGGRPILCRQGYPVVHAPPCSVACIEAQGQAFCAESTEPDPLCPGPPEPPNLPNLQSYCTDDNLLVYCQAGYRVGEKDCDTVTAEPRRCEGSICRLVSAP
jgi:hypothetical protein